MNYLCVTCKKFHETIESMKKCDHIIEKSKVTKAKREKAVPKAKDNLTDKERYDSLLPNLNDLVVEEIKFIADYLKVAFINKPTTIKLIKAKLGIE